jgi:hypothetical protein
MLSFQRPSEIRVRRVDGKGGIRGEFTLVCGVWDAFEYGGPVGQFLIVDGTEME